MNRSTQSIHRGFALVVTLSLMILLTLIAVGMLSLSAVSLRGSSQESAKSEARANARLALMLAIGEIQKQLGPDQRISANSAILSESDVKNPHWTGVWNSWKAGNGEASQHSTIQGVSDEMAPTYQTQRQDHFRGWLLSLDQNDAKDVAAAGKIDLSGSNMPAANAVAVQLIGEGSLGKGSKSADFVSASLLKVMPAATGGKPSGRYGWWVGDESQKARIMDDSYLSSSSLTMADKVFRQQAPASTGTTTIKGLQNISNDGQLATLPSLQTLDLVSGASGKPAQNFHSVTPYSFQVLADVREGGLKRDLSTLLERPISTTETQDDFLLYRFDGAGQERVPIQDLAAFYQLYDSSRDPNRVKGIRYTSSPQNNLLASGIQVAAPDYGDGNSQQNKEKYLREYTSLYRSPVPIKVQLLVGMKAEPIANPPAGGNTHRLILGFLPAVTLWNPNNAPITMNLGDPNLMSQMLRFLNLPFAIEWNLSNGYVSKPVSLAYAASSFSNPDTGQAGASNKNEFIFDMYFSATAAQSIVFQPGEVRLFSYGGFNGNFSMDTSGNQRFIATQEANPGWDTSKGFHPGRNSAWRKSTERPSDPNFMIFNGKGFLAFKASDNISVKIKSEKECGLPYPLAYSTGGAAMNFVMAQKSYAVQLPSHTTMWGWNNYDFHCRTGSNTLDFNDGLLRKGYPKQPFTTSVTGQELINLLRYSQPVDQWKAFLQFALMGGCETSEATNGTPFAGRKFASRPYLHSSPIKPPYIDSDDNNAMYNYGWSWWVQDINSILEANIESSPTDIRNGFYGGGYSITNGTSHVVQQEIPVTPPISIAALSHAHLGGFSIASESPNSPPGGFASYERVTAAGYGGLFPHTLQAIGNSYAHPNLASNKAFRSDWSRTFVMGSPKSVTFADHSYLANKALWDEYFFSSITPQPSAVNVFESRANRTAEQVAKDFFKDDPVPLPNRRMTRVKNLDSAEITSMFKEKDLYGNGFQSKYGLADKIASRLMVRGAFNINSTSVEAWKTFLSSLKGKPVAYLDKSTALTGGVKLSESTATGTPVGPVSLPNGKPAAGSSKAPADADQWSNWRELSDTEITELATAIVNQVKLRGPFLSLSEFVNRRLDSSNPQLSAKGALQAALDDEKVSINAGFRNAAREFSSDELSSMKPAFPEALKGPVAYGSAAYVDQADVLRGFAEQISPRGDTFVIRTYGDSLDASGKVQARAWCEAVVQRIPDYVDAVDESYLKQSALTSQANKTFGRKFNVVGFRWLNPYEV